MEFVNLNMHLLHNLAQMLKNPPAVQEFWVRFLGQEELQGMATHSSIFARRIPWT